MADIHDFNPNGPLPPDIPSNAKLWDFSTIWPYLAHRDFYFFYLRDTSWHWADGSSAEWAILGGPFLNDVRAQSDVVQEEQLVAVLAGTRAQSLCNHLQEGETDSFYDRGYALMHSDGWTNVLMSLGRFSLFWSLEGTIGPKIRRPDGTFQANYSVTITWTLYDYYDFPGWVLLGSVPELFGQGHPYYVTATWTTSVRGIARCRFAGHDVGPEDESSVDGDAQQVLIGTISITNDCDGQAASIPDRCRVSTELLGAQGNVVPGEAVVTLTPDPTDPNNPRKIGSYSIGVRWPPGHGAPAKWRTPKATRMDGSEICAAIGCGEGRCLDMVTRERFVPLATPVTTCDLRISCTCMPG